MGNFQDTFETCKRLFISAFSICMTVPLRFENFRFWFYMVCIERDIQVRENFSNFNVCIPRNGKLVLAFLHSANIQEVNLSSSPTSSNLVGNQH